METRDADALCGAGDFDVEPAASRDREFVLGDLVALGKVGIEIVFAGEARTLVHGAIQGDRGAHGHFDRAFVQDGKRAGETEAHRTDVRVWRIAETRRAAAEDFGFGEKLYVDFEADDRLVFRQDLDRKSTRLNSSHRCISYAVFCLK